MPKFEAVIRKVDLKIVEEKETTVTKVFIRFSAEVPFNSGLWEFLGSSAGESLQVEVDRIQTELALSKSK